MERLRQRADFVAAARGQRATNPAFVVQKRTRDDDGPVRIGFTVTKKVGSSPQRNRIRRRLREVVRQSPTEVLPPQSDIVIVARRDALTRNFAALRDDLATALRRLARSPVSHA